MSDERWIRVRKPDFYFHDELEAEEAYAAAEGQRVESIRWCETHDQSADTPSGGPSWCRPHFTDCVIVSATLILPPKGAA